MKEVTRYSDEELLTLLKDIESDCVERKRNFSDGDKCRQAVCAFANDLPGHNRAGVLFIGAEDDGTLSHLSITDELLRNLSDMARDGKTLPLPVMTVEKRVLDGANLAVVTVMPSDMPPVKYDGWIWIRIGARRALASEKDERILNERRRYKILPYDLYPIYPATINDLSKTYFEEEYLPTAFAAEVLEENNRTYFERLASCRMIVSPDDTTPTLLGLLTLGKHPQDYLFGAFIQFIRIDGPELGSPVTDELVGDGRLIKMLQDTAAKMIAHNRKAYTLNNGPHIITDDYPHDALMQILYNAVLHRHYDGTNAPVRVLWFNDRVEIISPGGPYGNVTEETFGKPGYVDYRNPNLAVVMKNLDLIQRFGQGIHIAREAMMKNGNPPIEFDTRYNHVRCILRRKDT